MFENVASKYRIAKYRRLIDEEPKKRPKGGIFKYTMRCRLLGAKNLRGRKSKSDFWHDVRTYVKTALDDLLLFAEVAGKENVNRVITKETLKPIFDVLLWYPVVKRQEPDLTRAEVAHLLIEAGFGYLREIKRDNIPLSSHRVIEEAVDLSNYLVELFKPEEERTYSTPAHYYGYDYSA